MKFFPRFPCGADGRAVYGHMITKFSYFFYLPMVLRWRASRVELRYQPSL